MLLIIILKWLLLRGKLFATLVEDIEPSIPVWPTIMVTAVLAVYGYGHHRGELAIKSTQAIAEMQMESKNAKIKKNIDNLSDKQLDKRLHRFCRDC